MWKPNQSFLMPQILGAIENTRHQASSKGKRKFPSRNTFYAETWESEELSREVNPRERRVQWQSKRMHRALLEHLLLLLHGLFDGDPQCRFIAFPAHLPLSWLLKSWQLSIHYRKLTVWISPSLEFYWVPIITTSIFVDLGLSPFLKKKKKKKKVTLTKNIVIPCVCVEVSWDESQDGQKTNHTVLLLLEALFFNEPWSDLFIKLLLCSHTVHILSDINCTLYNWWCLPDPPAPRKK